MQTEELSKRSKILRRNINIYRSENWQMGKSLEERKKYEASVILAMIRIYCKKNHAENYKKSGHKLCDSCQNLLDYCDRKIEKCPLGEKKTTCETCKIHCYAKNYREEVKKVMRFAGPRMMIYHPIMAVRHLISKIKG